MLVLKKISKGHYQNKVGKILVTVEKNEIKGWSGSIEIEEGLKKDVFCGGLVMTYESLYSTSANTKKDVAYILEAWIKHNF